MAVVSIGDLQLIDQWPGHVNPNLGIPTNGWDSTTDNFVTTAADTPPPSYPIGTKIEAYTDNSNNPGYYTMAYLAYHCISSAIGLIEADDMSIGKCYCFHYDASDAVAYASQGADTSIVPYYVVAGIESHATTAAVTDATKGGCLAIPCLSKSAGESTAAYVSGFGDSFGWFWVGGVCPVSDVTLFKGEADTTFVGFDLTTDAHVISAPFVVEFTTDSGILEYAGMSIGLDTTHVETGLPYDCAVGYSCTSAR